VVNAVAATVSLDTMNAGAKEVVSGKPENTYLNQGLQGLGMSPGAAGLTELVVGGGAAVTAGAVANKTIDQSIAVSKLSAASYGDFTTNGVKVTPEMMQTPVAQALVKEIQAGNPALPTSVVERFAKEYIESGSNFPQAGMAAQGTTLFKVVPKGDSVSPYSGYWMSPQQAQSIATMAPEQAGQLLGLPAAQAANILKSGMDFYAISPKAGVMPNVFVSNVAATTQGAALMPGGAQQVLVPNRAQWTTPIQISPFSFMSGGAK
jgi:filamentous hemagglutinin